MHNNWSVYSVQEVVYYCGDGMFMSTLWPEGRYVTWRDRDSWYAISSAASIRLSSTKPSPAPPNDLANSFAASASPSAEMIAAIFCCSAYYNLTLYILKTTLY